MRFEFDPEGGALYVRVRDGEVAETLEMAEPGFGAYLDIDREGNVLGVEFLSFEEFKELSVRFGGRLEIPDTVEDPDAPLRPRRRDREYDSGTLQEAISSLTPRHQELLRLRFMEGYTFSETADRLGITVAAVRSGTKAALGRLRDVLEVEATREENASSENVPKAEDERFLVAAISALGSTQQP